LVLGLWTGAFRATWNSRLGFAFSRGSCSHLFAAIIGAIAFRLRGPYFTLATIAFGEVLRLVATNLNVTGRSYWSYHARTLRRQNVLALILSRRHGFSCDCLSDELLDFSLALRYYLMAIRER